METTTVLVSSLFGNEVQYIIPLFQRHYVWDKDDQWLPLWEDIEEKINQRVSVETANEHSTHHFTGAIVIQQRDTHVNEVKKYEIIDGQQRLTTFQIILCAIRNICQEQGYKGILNKVERYIRNEFYNSNDEQYKLIPTEYDRDTFISLIDSGSVNNNGLIQQAHQFFRSKIDVAVNNDEKQLQILFRSILEDFALVQIRLDPDDQPEKIFESLNARGKALLQFDLLRNNLFLKARVDDDRDQLYKDYWKHFETPDWEKTKTVARKKITLSELFFQHFIMAKTGAENVTPLFNTYQNEYQKKLRRNENKGVRYELSELKKYSETYKELVDCPSDSVLGQSMLFYNTFDIVTLHPFILFIINELAVSDLDLPIILHILESYTVRRLLCLRTQKTKSYTKLFSLLIRKLKGKPFHLDNFINLLSEEKADATRYPTDDDVKEYLMPWQASDVDANIMRYILYRIELIKRDKNQLMETELIDFDRKLTLEHIMPQQWRNTWHLPLVNENGTDTTIMYRDLFSDEYKKEHNLSLESFPDKEGLIDEKLEPTLELALDRNRFLYSIGNLTLVTGRLNASLSNDIFPIKKESLFKNSRLLLNREVCEHDTWDTTEIWNRAEQMVKLFYEIWPSLAHFSERNTCKIRTNPEYDNVLPIQESNDHSSAQQKTHTTAEYNTTSGRTSISAGWSKWEQDIGSIIIEILEYRDPSGLMIFQPRDIQDYYPRLKQTYPDNNNIGETVSKMLASLVNRGELVKPNRGEYRVVENKLLHTLLKQRNAEKV